MTQFKQLVAIVLVAGLIPVGFPREAQATAAAERSEAYRQKVEQLGAGAEVRATLKGQQVTLRGTVESFDDSVVRLRRGGTGGQKIVPYADVTLLEITKRRYRAEGSPDPVTVRRVAVELGVGSKVRVQTQDRNKFVGRIAKLDTEQLYLNLGDRGPVGVSYAQISELKSKGMSLAAKIAIGGGLAGGAVIAAFVGFLVYGEH